MKLQIKPLASDIIISIYIIATLYLRFKYEAQFQISPINSLVMGFSFILLIWALINLKILNPNWFGLFNSKK